MPERRNLEHVFLVHHTHMDIGYTDLPGEVREQHLNHLDTVLDLCRGNADREEEARFYWTCESAFLVKDYLRCRPRSRVEELLQALRTGWIELQAFLTQPLTELPTAEELIDCIQESVDLGRREKFGVHCGMIDDIGGYTGRLPSVLSGLGVPYLVAGVGAFQVYLPWAELPHLFYLEAADGCRTLVWNLGINRRELPQVQRRLEAVYGQGALFLVMPFRQALTGHMGRGVETDIDPVKLTGDARERFAAFEARLGAEDYPYPEVMLQYGGDNRGPDAEIVSLIQAINRRPDMPDVHLTTPTRFLAFMENKYRDRIPVIRGVITDPWNLRVNPQPVPVKLYRQAQRQARSALARLTLSGNGPTAQDYGTLARMTEAMHLFADHTCGLSEWGWEKAFEPQTGCRAPGFDRYRQSWQANRYYAETALSCAQELARRADGRILGGGSERVVVFNDSTRIASGPAELYVGRDHAPLASLADPQTGEPVPFQTVARNRAVILAPPVPGLGARELEATFGRSETAALETTDTGIDNGVIRLDFDRHTGQLRSVKGVTSGREWLDPAAPCSFGEVIHHFLGGVPYGQEQAGMAQDIERRESRALPGRVTVTQSGPVIYEVVIDETIPRKNASAIGVRRTYRMYRGFPRIDFQVRLDKGECEKKEAVYAAFPFSGNGDDFCFDQNLGVVTPGRDLVPGAMTDLFLCHGWGMFHTDSGSVVMTFPDAPVVHIGDIRMCRWEQRFPFTPGNAHAYSQIYHNLLNTDCPVWQDILADFSYSFHFVEDRIDPGAAAAIAETMLNPLRARLGSLDAGYRKNLPAAEVASESVRLLSLKRLPDGRMRLRLENLADVPVETEIKINRPLREVWLEDLQGRGISMLPIIRSYRIPVVFGPCRLLSLAVLEEEPPPIAVRGGSAWE